MMRAMALGVVAIASTLLGNFASSLLMQSKQPEALKAEPLALDLIRLEPISVPIIRSGKVEGYVVARVSVSADAADVKSSKPLLIAYASEAAFRAIYEERAFDTLAITKVVELPGLADRIVKIANERIGRPTIKQAMVENLSVVPKSEVRG